MKKYLVTGGAGFIGSYIAKSLESQGHEVIIFDIRKNPKDNVRDLERLKKASEGCDGIFHLAAIASVQYSIDFPQETFAVNFEGTLNVLEAARVNKIRRVVYSSSSAVYGVQKTFPTKEIAECHPQSPYALQKHMSEALLAMYSNLFNVETVALRYFNVYGKGQSSTGAYASVIAKFLDLHKNKKTLTITGDGKQTRDFIHVSDVVKANILAMRAPSSVSGQSFNIGSGERISVNDVARIIGGPIKKIPARIEPKNSCADISKAKKVLKWSPKMPFARGLGDLMA